MDEPQHRELCERVARAQGMDVGLREEGHTYSYTPRASTRMEQCTRCGWSAKKEPCYVKPPDPCHNAQDCVSLARFMREQGYILNLEWRPNGTCWVLYTLPGQSIAVLREAQEPGEAIALACDAALQAAQGVLGEGGTTE